jgi:choline monooxygenase
MDRTPASPVRRYSVADLSRAATYRQTRLPVDWASTLLPEAYRSAEFCDLEQERVWAMSRVPAGDEHGPARMFASHV